MIRGSHRVLDPRRRFRDRLLAGMVLVALLPLGVFGLLVAADLGGITNRTVDEAHRTIRNDLENRQQTIVVEDAKLADARLGAIASDVAHQLHDALVRSLASTRTAAPVAGLVPNGAVDLAGSGTGSPASLMVRRGQEAASAQPAAAAAALTTTMLELRHAYPEVEASWVIRRSSGLLFAVPGFDIASALATRRISPALPQVRAGEDVFAASQARMGAAESASWAPPSGGSAPGLFWTDAYPLMEDGSEGITAWMAVGGTDTLVGVDISLARLTNAMLPAQVTNAAAADTLLISSSNMVLSGSGALQHDFNLPPEPAGSSLSLAPGPGFGNGLHTAETTGRYTVLQARLAGSARELVAAPLYSSHWLLATVVPVSDFEPDLAALSRGVDSGIHSLYLEALPVLLLLLLLAFLLASLMARRLVLPVRVLTSAAGRLAAGHTEERILSQGSDEVGQLAESLERMRQDINSSRDTILAASRELEARVTARTHELRNRNEELIALNDLASSLTRSLNPHEIIADALSAVRAIVPGAVVGGYLVQGGALRVVEAPGDQPAASADRLIAAAERCVADATLLDEHEAVGRVIAVPLSGAEGALGALVVRTRRRRVAAETLRLLRAIGDQVGLALRTAALSAESQKTAVLSERARLAREIHDTLAQQLTAVVLQLEAAEALIARDPGRAQASIDTAREMARAALQEARRSVWDLRPTPLTATGLLGALAAEVEQWGERRGVAATFHSDAIHRPLSLSPLAEVTLLRILQEALTNAGRHSGAAQVDVRLERAGDEVRLTIEDDGSGFESGDETRAGAFGLVSMAERARLAGGSLTVTSAPGTGTTLSVQLPLGSAVAVPA